jgi:SAM-dependent methyltransferase
MELMNLTEVSHNEYSNINEEEYTLLYARYMSRDKLYDFLDIQKDELVLDVCAGVSLRLSKMAAQKGAIVFALDECYSEDFTTPNQNIILIKNKLQNYQFGCKFDWIACQQGINYWFGENSIYQLYKSLKHNGKFVFNTFNKKPSSVPTFKEYEIDGVKFGEAFQLVGNVVHHFQMREGMEPHFTKFRWIDPEEFRSVLSPFHFEEHIDGNSTTYVCSKI